MMKKRLLCAVLAVVLCTLLIGCQKPAEPKKVTLIIKTPPVSLGSIPDVGEAEAYDMLTVAAENFAAQYGEFEVDFQISRYGYQDEQTQLVDKFGTPEAADLFFSGSWNTPQFAKQGLLVPLDDIIDDELRADIDQAIWDQCSIDGQVYTAPFHQLQNTLMVNRQMMIGAGLESYIPGTDEIAHWSTEDFDLICARLTEYLVDENTFAFMMYAANNQGDNHIMTLLRAQGGTLYDAAGNFCVNTPEGIAALAFIKDMDEKGYTPRGAENLELVDCVNLFNNGQLAICMGNLTNLWGARSVGLDIFAVNFPSPDGAGYCTSSTNGLCVFDNGDADKVRVAKDFVRYLYTDEAVMKYTLGTLPVNASITRQYQSDVWMLGAYGENNVNTVDNIRNNLNWQGVRSAFYPNIAALLRGDMTPEQAAAAIDEGCNAALAQGRTEFS